MRRTAVRACATVSPRASRHAGRAIASAATTTPASTESAAQAALAVASRTEARRAERGRPDHRGGAETDSAAGDPDEQRLGESEARQHARRGTTGAQERLVAAAPIGSRPRDRTGQQQRPAAPRAGRGRGRRRGRRGCRRARHRVRSRGCCRRRPSPPCASRSSWRGRARASMRPTGRGAGRHG